MRFDPNILITKGEKPPQIRIVLTKYASLENKISEIARNFGDVQIEHIITAPKDRMGFAILITDRTKLEDLSIMDPGPCSHRIFISKKHVGNTYDPRYDWRVDPKNAINSILEILIKIDKYKMLFLSGLVEKLKTSERYDLDTKGHGKRVSIMSMILAEALNASNATTIFDDIKLAVLLNASLFHDVGKAKLPPKLLGKHARLPDEDLRTLIERYHKTREFFEILLKENKAELKFKLDEINNDLNFVLALNKTTKPLPQDLERLFELQHKKYCVGSINFANPLTEHDYIHLSVEHGNYTEEERREMQLHAEWSRIILDDCIWPNALALIPDVAGTHHEYYVGGGYPSKKPSKNLDVIERIIPILDEYDALRSKRIYREKISYNVEETLAELQHDVVKGRLDPELVDFIIRHKIYRLFEEAVAFP